MPLAEKAHCCCHLQRDRSAAFELGIDGRPRSARDLRHGTLWDVAKLERLVEFHGFTSSPKCKRAEN